jgi:glycosyltransferase involved in cell wall biosynthesis
MSNAQRLLLNRTAVDRVIQMRVLLIEDMPSTSGIGRYAFSLATESKKIGGQDMEVLSLDSGTLNSLLSKASGHPLLHRIGQVMNVSWKTLGSYRVPAGYQVYHLTNASLSPIARRFKPSVVTVHDLIPFMPWIRSSFIDFFLKLSTRDIVHADRVLCDSESTRKDVIRIMEVEPKKTRVVYLGVDHNLFRRRDKRRMRLGLNLPVDRVTVLNVGTEESRKNIATLLNAFKNLLKYVPGAILVRIGQKSERSDSLIRGLGLDGKVIYKYPSAREVAYYYNAADMLCFPSYHEGFGFPPLEAMASGLPVLAGNRSSIPEIIGDSGIMLDPFDIEGFAHWMYELSKNNDLRASISEKGYKRSLNFTWSKCANECYQVYKELSLR